MRWLSHYCSWILTAACFSGDNVSIWTGVRSSSLGDNFWISDCSVIQFPLCDQTRPWFRFSTRTSSVAGLAFFLVASTRATLTSYLFCSSYLFCKLWLCRVLIAAGAFLTDVDRFPWKSQSEFCVVRAAHKFKSLGFACSPSFFSLPAACRLFSRGVIFTRPCVSLALLSLKKNGALLVVSKQYGCL